MKMNNELKSYFDEIEPAFRLEFLNKLSDNAETDFLRNLYQKRYSVKGRDVIDHWMWCCLSLKMLYSCNGFFRRSLDKEINEIFDKFCMNDNDENHREFLYCEYRNVARRYLSTCKSSGYASRLMGLKQASDDEKVIQACKDIWEMSRGFAVKNNLQDKMKIFCDAFYDEIIKFSPLSADIFEALESVR